MKAEFERGDIQAIAQEVVEMIRPIISEQIERSDTDEILTIDEAAALFKLKKSQFYYWVSESKYADNPIPFMKAGKHLRFSKRELIQWLKKKSR